MQPPTTRLLVSVRDVREARIALASGADLIDVKEPTRGSLGPADGRVVEEVIGEVGGRVPVSAALGDLGEGNGTCQPGVPGGLTYAKLGLAGVAGQADWPDRWEECLRRLPESVRPVAVVYADWPSAGAPEPARVLAAATRLGCEALLVDTFDKSGGGLLERWPSDDLCRFVGAVRREGMRIVLAGSLSFRTIPRVLPLGPDYVAVRGAACGGCRVGTVRGDLVRRLGRLIKERDSRRFSGFA